MIGGKIAESYFDQAYNYLKGKLGLQPLDKQKVYDALDGKLTENGKPPKTVAEMKATPALADMPMIRQSRLSVSPI